MLAMLQRGFMFEKDRMEYITQTMHFMIRHNLLHVEKETLPNGKRVHNERKKRFFHYLLRSIKGGNHDTKIPLEVYVNV